MAKRGLVAGATLRRDSGVSGVVSAIRLAEAVPTMVPVESIAANPDNPQVRAAEGLETLTESVRELGVIQPLLVASRAAFVVAHPEHEPVVPVEAAWVALDGHRRLPAAVAAGLLEVPTFVRDDLAGRSDEVMVQSSAQRLKLTPTQEAAAYLRLLESRGVSQRELAAHLGVSQANISKRLKLLRLPASIQIGVDEGVYTLADALAVLDEPVAIQKLSGDRVGALWGDLPLADEDGVRGSLGELTLSWVVQWARSEHRNAEARVMVEKRGGTFEGDPYRLLGGKDYYRARLTTDEQIEKASAEGTLIGTLIGADVVYFTTAPPEEPPSPKAPVVVSPLVARCAAAAEARQGAVEALLSQKPSRTDVRLAAVAVVLSERSIIDWWWTWQKVPGGGKPSKEFLAGLRSASAEARDVLVWQFYVVAMSRQLESWNEPWAADHVAFIELLERVGYTRQPYDLEQIAMMSTEDAS